MAPRVGCSTSKVTTIFVGTLSRLSIVRSMISLKLRDGRQLVYFSRNISRIKQDMKKLQKGFVSYFKSSSKCLFFSLSFKIISKKCHFYRKRTFEKSIISFLVIHVYFIRKYKPSG